MDNAFTLRKMLRRSKRPRRRGRTLGADG
ncbi:protein of unknown function [Azospirillum baldaniorum]|uniref:Uncharacterized protein n=1 Tax=Azospirillum baldaniorum TaxID=1064539 RepID=A0A9P1JNJ5_9PROT|nr:protein of unknown function [Azospirillum baldaniorum]